MTNATSFGVGDRVRIVTPAIGEVTEGVVTKLDTDRFGLRRDGESGAVNFFLPWKDRRVEVVEPVEPLADWELELADPFGHKVRQLFTEAAELLLSKHRDYGPLNIAHSPGGPVNGLRVRLHDKLARLNHLTDTSNDPEHESLEDTWRDIVGYGAIGLLVSRGDWPSE